MRERLIELLKQVDKKCDNSIECKDCAGYGKGMWCKEYLTADHLLANGVIVPMYEQSMEETLKDIVQYNGHAEWLTELVKQIEESKKEEEYFSCPLPTKQWHTEEHAIWMFLVGMFGDWGTSIRSGWISNHDECIDFIKYLIRPYGEDEEGGEKHL